MRTRFFDKLFSLYYSHMKKYPFASFEMFMLETTVINFFIFALEPMSSLLLCCNGE